ncbi:MAG: GNAT family N-acetyltransferase [Chloroflexota bacterium]
MIEPPEPDGVLIRMATVTDLAACEDVWRDGLNDYLMPLGQMKIEPDNAQLRQLHAHLLATDPSLFWVATRPDGPGATSGETVIAFAAAARRGPTWFLSMLFVRPGEQARGLGRRLLEQILPNDGVVRAVATDPAQPISNGLYAVVGMVARLPVFNLVGRPTRSEALEPLPEGMVAAGPVGKPDGATIAAEIDELDRETLGYDHEVDHAYLRRGGRMCFTYRDAAGRLAGYGYTSAVGRIGPVAVRPALPLASVVADLLTAVSPRGASAIWVTGQAGPTIEMLVRAGLRIEGFPVLLGWNRTFAAFDRYIPTSPGLL